MKKITLRSQGGKWYVSHKGETAIFGNVKDAITYISEHAHNGDNDVQN